MKIPEIAGWIGVLLILLAYCLITFSVIAPENIAFGLMNLFGAIGIIISSYSKKDFQPVALNVVWLLIAIIGIVKSQI
ncbi:MAG: CBU_0592 family membrane protein [Candidatus Saccharimonadales bacterium]